MKAGLGLFYLPRFVPKPSVGTDTLPLRYSH